MRTRDWRPATRAIMRIDDATENILIDFGVNLVLWFF